MVFLNTFWTALYVLDLCGFCDAEVRSVLCRILASNFTSIVYRIYKHVPIPLAERSKVRVELYIYYTSWPS